MMPSSYPPGGSSSRNISKEDPTVASGIDITMKTKGDLDSSDKKIDCGSCIDLSIVQYLSCHENGGFKQQGYSQSNLEHVDLNKCSRVKEYEVKSCRECGSKIGAKFSFPGFESSCVFMMPTSNPTGGTSSRSISKEDPPVASGIDIAMKTNADQDSGDEKIYCDFCIEHSIIQLFVSDNHSEKVEKESCHENGDIEQQGNSHSNSKQSDFSNSMCSRVKEYEVKSCRESGAKIDGTVKYKKKGTRKHISKAWENE